MGLLSVGTHAAQAEHASPGTREHEHPEDTLAVHLRVVLPDEHLGGDLVRASGRLGRGLVRQRLVLNIQCLA